MRKLSLGVFWAWGFPLALKSQGLTSKSKLTWGYLTSPSYLLGLKNALPGSPADQYFCWDCPGAIGYFVLDPLKCTTNKITRRSPLKQLVKVAGFFRGFQARA